MGREEKSLDNQGKVLIQRNVPTGSQEISTGEGCLNMCSITQAEKPYMQMAVTVENTFF